jgi:hypothetical protein
MFVAPLSFLAFVFVVSDTVFEQLVDGNAACNEACDRTFPANTRENVEYATCCKRGCRFFSLVELISESTNPNSTEESCMASCLEAYTRKTDQSYACGFGCSKQVPHTNTLLVQDPSLGVLSLAARHAYEVMVDRMWRIVGFSWSLSVRRQDGGLLVVQSVVQSPKLQDDESGEYELEHQGLPVPDVYLDLDLDMNGRRSDQSPPLDPASDVLITVNSYSSHDVGVDWLSCVSRKTGLPRWLLAVVIFLCVMVTVWLCFTGSSSPSSNSPQLSVSCNVDYNPVDSFRKDLMKFDRCDAPPLPLKMAVDRV